MELDRRHFIAATAATFGTDLVAPAREILAQTATGTRSALPPVPPDAGLFDDFNPMPDATIFEAVFYVTGLTKTEECVCGSRGGFDAISSSA